MSDLYYCVDGEYKKLGKIEEIPVLTDEEIENDELAKSFVNMSNFTQEMSFDVKIECEGDKNPIRMLMSGGDKGRYNALTLKEDGYLSPKNGWL